MNCSFRYETTQIAYESSKTLHDIYNLYQIAVPTCPDESIINRKEIAERLQRDLCSSQYLYVEDSDSQGNGNKQEQQQQHNVVLDLRKVIDSQRIICGKGGFDKNISLLTCKFCILKCLDIYYKYCNTFMSNIKCESQLVEAWKSLAHKDPFST